MRRDATDYKFLELELEINFLKKHLELSLKNDQKVGKSHIIVVDEVISKLNKVKDGLKGEVRG